MVINSPGPYSFQARVPLSSACCRQTVGIPRLQVLDAIQPSWYKRQLSEHRPLPDELEMKGSAVEGYDVGDLQMLVI